MRKSQKLILDRGLKQLILEEVPAVEVALIPTQENLDYPYEANLFAPVTPASLGQRILGAFLTFAFTLMLLLGFDVKKASALELKVNPLLEKSDIPSCYNPVQLASLPSDCPPVLIASDCLTHGDSVLKAKVTLVPGKKMLAHANAVHSNTPGAGHSNVIWTNVSHSNVPGTTIAHSNVPHANTIGGDIAHANIPHTNIGGGGGGGHSNAWSNHSNSISPHINIQPGDTIY